MDFELSSDILFKSLRLPETTLAALTVALYISASPYPHASFDL